MKTEYLHFTLGENAGRLLVDIAREHLLYSYNPQKALETITSSLTGCPKDIALDIIIGKLILLVMTRIELLSTALILIPKYMEVYLRD